MCVCAWLGVAGWGSRKDRGNGAGRGGGVGGVGRGSADGGRKLMDGYEEDFKCSQGEKKRPRENKAPKPLARRKAAAAQPEPRKPAHSYSQATPLLPSPHPSPTHRLFQKSTQTLRGLGRSIEVGITVGAALGWGGWGGWGGTSEISDLPPAVTAPSLC